MQSDLNKWSKVPRLMPSKPWLLPHLIKRRCSTVLPRLGTCLSCHSCCSQFFWSLVRFWFWIWIGNFRFNVRFGEVWSWDVNSTLVWFDFAENVEHDDYAYVDETHHHDCIRCELQSVDVFRKECKLVSLLCSRPSLHVGKPGVLVWCLCSSKRTLTSFLFLRFHSNCIVLPNY